MQINWKIFFRSRGQVSICYLFRKKNSTRLDKKIQTGLTIGMGCDYQPITCFRVQDLA
nr:MAG TPA: hypothetical protein [Caudoviricetes sp.]